MVIGAVVGLLCVGFGIVDVWVAPIGYVPVLGGLAVFDRLIAAGLVAWSPVPGMNPVNRRLRWLPSTFVHALGWALATAFPSWAMLVFGVATGMSFAAYAVFVNLLGSFRA